MADTHHHIEADSVESATEVSVPELSQTHHLKAESVESSTEVSTPELSVLVEKIQLTDRASDAEKRQMLQWAKERLEEIQALIEDVSEILEIVQNELSKVLSTDAMQALIEFLQEIFKIT